MKKVSLTYMDNRPRACFSLTHRDRILKVVEVDFFCLLCNVYWTYVYKSRARGAIKWSVSSASRSFYFLTDEMGAHFCKQFPRSFLLYENYRTQPSTLNFSKKMKTFRLYFISISCEIFVYAYKNCQSIKEFFLR